VAREKAEEFLADDSRVFILRAEGLTIVYPEVLLAVHHVINETFDRQPLAVTYCLLTGSAMVYSRAGAQGRLTFGGLGTLYHGNVVLHDLETGSYWAQLTGEAFHGKLQGSVLPVHMPLLSTTWGRVKDLPFINVLAPQDALDSYRRFYDSERAGQLGLASVRKSGAAVDARLEPYVHGLGIAIQGEARFYPLEAVKKAGLVNDLAGGWAIAVVHDRRFDCVRIYRRYARGRRLTLALEGQALVDPETGTRWDLDGKGLAGSLRGTDLARPVYTEAYWFAWAAFFPGTGIHGEPAAR
jgi:hypothetical protein